MRWLSCSLAKRRHADGMRSDIRIAVLSSNARSLIRFRGALMHSIASSGAKVYALAPDFDDETREAIRELGVHPVSYRLSRTGMNPVRDTMDTLQLTQLLKTIAPDITFAYFIKPVVYGSMASRLAGVPRRFSLIAGLGYTFTPSDGPGAWRRYWIRCAVDWLYRLALRLNERVFFQNQDDMRESINAGWVRPGQVVELAGTGVDLEYFTPAEPVTDPVSFLWMGRMLREKGVYDFVEAARLVKAQYPEVRFTLLGAPDSAPTSLDRREVMAWVEAGLVEWPGQVPDVRPWISRASVFVLPSYYREGKPRSTQEAMAMGRPIITTDAPGCRETVEEGRNGFRVPPRDPRALAEAMRTFIEEPELIISMGSESRRIAESKYDVHAINRLILETIGIRV